MTFSAMYLCFDFLSFFLFFDHMGWGILAPRPAIKPGP